MRRYRGVASQRGPVRVVLAGQTLTRTVHRPHKRLGAVWTWQELVGTVALIPFQSFKLPRRLPVSGPRLPARGSHVQATGTAADGSGQCVLGRGSNLEPEHKRDRRAGCLRLTHSAAVFIGLPSGGACAPGGRMTHYGEGSKY